MSNLKVNIRFWCLHLQITNSWRFSITYNKYHRELPDGWFDVYKFELR